MAALLEGIEAQVANWSGVALPNEPARGFAADLAGTLAGFERLRGTLVFEDEPADFEAALQATKDSFERR